jgi:radical S-adenosyl methionine domain-containing protein 2
MGASGLLASKLGQQLHPQGSQPQPMHVNPSSIDRNSLASNGSKGFARRLLQGTAINIHFTRKCNFECKFCFHTAKTSFTLPLADLQQILTLCRLHGAEKVNFAGGEPFLKPYRYLLGELVKHCKEIGFHSVSIISNGSTSHSWRPWFVDYGKYLDILGISLDSADPLTNYSHGRWPRGLVFDASKAVDSKTNRGLISIRVAAKLASEFGVKFKVNTVVTKNNKDESVAHVINELKPMRWKVFQVLPIVGENIAATQPLPAAQSQALPIATPSQATFGASGASVGGCASGNCDVTALLITDREFEQFLSLNRGLLDDVSVLVPENNSDMLSSYILIDEFGRFLDCSTGAKTPTSSIIDVGIEEASRELLENGTDHGGFDKEKFLDRGGYYPETWVRDSV